MPWITLRSEAVCSVSVVAKDLRLESKGLHCFSTRVYRLRPSILESTMISVSLYIVWETMGWESPQHAGQSARLTANNASTRLHTHQCTFSDCYSCCTLGWQSSEKGEICESESAEWKKEWNNEKKMNKRNKDVFILRFCAPGHCRDMILKTKKWLTIWNPKCNFLKIVFLSSSVAIFPRQYLETIEWSSVIS